MEISLYDAKAKFSKIIQDLIDEKEDVITITKHGKPVVQMVLINKKNTKRVGAAKEEMKNCHLSLEEFNAIPIDDFFGE